MITCPACRHVFFDPDADDVMAVSGNDLVDLVAEAARTSPHAAQAYALMRAANPAIPTLEARLRVIDSRNQGTA